jgi:hypothetical protein
LREFVRCFNDEEWSLNLNENVASEPETTFKFQESIKARMKNGQTEKTVGIANQKKTIERTKTELDFLSKIKTNKL